MDTKKVFDRTTLQVIERDEQELTDLVINYCQFEYRAARLILNLLNHISRNEVAEIIEDARQPYALGMEHLIDGDKLVKYASCYKKLVELKLTSKDIVKHRLSKWITVIYFMTQENAVHISGLMSGPNYLKKIKGEWGNIEKKRNKKV